MLRVRQQEGKVTEVNDASTTTIEDVAFDAGTVFEYNTTMITIGDSDGEDMGEGEVVGSDDDDPDPLKLPKPLVTPGKVSCTLIRLFSFGTSSPSVVRAPAVLATGG